MTAQVPPAPARTEQNDPYRMRTLEQILSLFDGGNFLDQLMEEHRQLQIDLLDHKEEHGTKGCSGSVTITLNYALGKSGDLSMGASSTIKGPKKPPASAAAYINDKGELTLYSPFLKRMHEPPRDVTNYDPETSEVRDID